jgi:hypothetical protein
MRMRIVDDSEKLKKYRFEEVGRYRRISEDTIEVENRKEEFFPAIYAIVIENRVKYIGSTTQRGRERRLALKPGKHKIVSLTRKISEELRSHKRAKLYYLTQLPNCNYEGLCFEILRDLEIALIKDFKTQKKYGGWNKVDK